MRRTATTSSALIAEAMEKVGKDGVITVEEAKAIETSLEVVEGMQFDRGYVSPVLRDQSGEDGGRPRRAVHSHPREEDLGVARAAAPARENRPDRQAVADLAEDVEGEALATLVVNKLRGTLKVAAVKAPGYGDRRKAMLEDLAILTAGKFVRRPRDQAREHYHGGSGPRQARGDR